MSQTKEPTTRPDPPSELFINCVRTAGSIVIDCEFCGRTHFGDGRGDYDEGELERLLEKAKLEPDKYIQHHDDDMVSYCYMSGKQAVLDCPCNHLRLYENFIWSHRGIIAEFLKRKCAGNLETARRDADEVARIPEELFTDEPRKRQFDLP